jgi:hypothetical protein
MEGRHMEKQCLLKRGDSTRVVWVPDKYAVVGNVISDKSSPDFGWTVKSVGASRGKKL